MESSRAATGNPAEVELTSTLDRFRRRYAVPAVVGAVTDRHDGLSAAVVGARDRAHRETATLDDRWHIGSCGKAITALLYARLVELGLAEWEVPVAELFTDLGGVHPGWGVPTVDDLLHCRAGVRPNLRPDDQAAWWACTLPMAEQRTRLGVEELAHAPREPGRFRYSNLSYVLVGAAIDRLAGMPFEAALARYVLDPLEITSLGFGPPPAVIGHGPRRRWGLLMVGRGGPADPADPHSDNPALLNPAGRMHLTIADWARFHRVFLRDGRSLVSVATRRRLLEVPPGGASIAMGWAPTRLPGEVYGMQGSNTMWVATALSDHGAGRAALVVTNDGRTRVLRASRRLAADLLRARPVRPRPAHPPAGPS